MFKLASKWRTHNLHQSNFYSLMNLEILTIYLAQRLMQNLTGFSAIGPSRSGPEPDDRPLDDDRHAEGQLDQRPPHDRHRRLDQLALQWIRHHQGRFEYHFDNRTTIKYI
jgi:hypothetical protein